MRTSAESQLRKIAFGLTAVILVQVVWSGIRLWTVSAPDPLPPATESLQVDLIWQSPPLAEEQSQELAMRPLFWEGRQAFIPGTDDAPVNEPRKRRGNSNIDDVALQGVYTSGNRTGVIVDYKGKQHRLLQNESVAGWKFTQLGGDGPVFESGRESRVLELVHARSVPAPVKQRVPAPAEHDNAGKADDKQDANQQDETQ